MGYPLRLKRAASPQERDRAGTGAKRLIDGPLQRDSYSVTVTTWGERTRQYARLKIVRLSDKRTIYPFVGAPEIGPFADSDAARDHAMEYGWSLVDSDIARPE